MGIINVKTTQILIDPPRVFSFLRFNRNHDAAQIFISNQSMYFIYIIIIIIHSSINVYHFANLYVLYSQQHLIILLYAPIHSVVTKKTEKNIIVIGSHIIM